MAARGDENQVVYVDGDIPQLPLQLGQLLVDTSVVEPGVTNLQQCTSQNPLVYEPLRGYWPPTPAEGNTVVNGFWPPGWIVRYGVSGAGDEAVLIQNWLNCGEVVIYGMGLACFTNSTLTVPAGTTVRDINVSLGATTTNLLLVNSSCKLHGRIAGTGTTNTVERGIYPAAQGVSDVELDIHVSNVTYGVHLQPLSGTAVVDRPKRWTGTIRAQDIVGDAGVTEGYGLLMSPAEQCDLVVIAKNVARHALCLSAGARYNRVILHIDGCDNYAAQLYSTSGQDATEHNDVTVFAQNLGENVAGQGGAVAILQKAHRNTLRVFHDGDGVTTFSIKVEGASGGPYPYGNRLIDGAITGEFTGDEVVQLKNADSTVVSHNVITAYANARVIGMLRTGTNGAAQGGYIEGNVIDAQGQNCKGIYNEINAQPSYIGPNEISNTGSAVRVDDQTGGWRSGFSRSARFTGTTATITASTVGDTSASLLQDVDTTRRHVSARITDSSVSLSNNSGVVRVGAPADSAHVAFRIYNAGADQTFNYEGVVYGD